MYEICKTNWGLTGFTLSSFLTLDNSQTLSGNLFGNHFLYSGIKYPLKWTNLIPYLKTPASTGCSYQDISLMLNIPWPIGISLFGEFVGNWKQYLQHVSPQEQYLTISLLGNIWIDFGFLPLKDGDPRDLQIVNVALLANIPQCRKREMVQEMELILHSAKAIKKSGNRYGTSHHRDHNGQFGRLC